MTDRIAPSAEILNGFAQKPSQDEVLLPGHVGARDVHGALKNSMEGISCAVLTASLRDMQSGEITSGMAAFERDKAGNFSPMKVNGKPLTLDNDSDAYQSFNNKTPEDHLNNSRRTLGGLASPMGTGSGNSKSALTVSVNLFEGDAAQCQAIRKNGLKHNPGM